MVFERDVSHYIWKIMNLISLRIWKIAKKNFVQGEVGKKAKSRDEKHEFCKE